MYRGASSIWFLSPPLPILPHLSHSYEEALQALADSEAKKETVDKELRLVSSGQRVVLSSGILLKLLVHPPTLPSPSTPAPLRFPPSCGIATIGGSSRTLPLDRWLFQQLGYGARCRTQHAMILSCEESVGVDLHYQMAFVNRWHY